MQFERIRKSHKKETIIGGLVVLGIVSALTFTTSRARYKLTESIPLVSGSINYKPYDFKIMAMYQSDDKTNYTEIETMPASGYTINESKSYCNMSDGNKDTTAVLKTIDGNHTIGNLKSNDRCYLYFDKELSPSEKSLEKLNITDVKDSPTTFTGVATADEGVFKVADGMYGGYSYYWRGAATNNYVRFANFCWRIIRINGDGSIRLIYDGTTCHPNGTSTTDSLIQPTSGTTTYTYNASYNQSNYVGWTYTGSSQRTQSGTASNAKTQTETWFNANITGTNLTKVDTSAKYCNDRDAQSGSTWAINGSTFYYAAYKRAYTDYAPTLSCPSGDVYTLKVGAITADEVMYAGGYTGAQNKNYYLYNGQNYWSMSPRGWYSSYASVFRVDSNGNLSGSNVSGTNTGLRPVINLKSDVTISNGNGTLDNPYVVS